MKKYILFTALLTMIFFSCQKLDLTPKGILGESELFGTEFGVKKYFTNIYDFLPIEDFLYYGNNVPYNPANNYSGNAAGGYRPTNYWEAGKNSLGNCSGECFNSWQWPKNGSVGSCVDDTLYHDT